MFRLFLGRAKSNAGANAENDSQLCESQGGVRNDRGGKAPPDAHRSENGSAEDEQIFRYTIGDRKVFWVVGI
jgi:hypothetical protein